MTTVTTIGRITKDLELKTSEKGCTYVNFSLAVNDGFGDKKTVLYFECTVFNADAERLIKAKAQKGSLIQVIGKLGVSEFTRTNGEPGFSLKLTVLAWNYVPVSNGQKEANGGNGAESGNTQTQPPAEHHQAGDYPETTNLDDEPVAA